MKRRIASILAAVTATALTAGCSNGGGAPAKASGEDADGWVRPPAILSFERSGAALVFHGQAEPGSRVVLRSGAAAYAAAADADGRFDIRMAAPTGDMLLKPETQLGQDAVPAPEQLLIVDGGRGPVALLRPGASTRRLDRAPALGAVDSDGRAMLASGTTAKGGPSVTVRLAGAEAAPVTTDADGRWTAALGPAPAGTATVTVGGEAFVWPGAKARSGALSVERAGAGWRIGWAGPAEAWQTAWLPEAVR